MTGRYYHIPQWKKDRILKMYEETELPMQSIADSVGVSVTTVSKYIKENTEKDKQ